MLSFSSPTVRDLCNQFILSRSRWTDPFIWIILCLSSEKIEKGGGHDTLHNFHKIGRTSEELINPSVSLVINDTKLACLSKIYLSLEPWHRMMAAGCKIYRVPINVLRIRIRIHRNGTETEERYPFCKKSIEFYVDLKSKRYSFMKACGRGCSKYLRNEVFFEHTLQKRGVQEKRIVVDIKKLFFS